MDCIINQSTFISFLIFYEFSHNKNLVNSCRCLNGLSENFNDAVWSSLLSLNGANCLFYPNTSLFWLWFQSRAHWIFPLFYVSSFFFTFTATAAPSPCVKLLFSFAFTSTSDDMCSHFYTKMINWVSVYINSWVMMGEKIRLVHVSTISRRLCFLKSSRFHASLHGCSKWVHISGLRCSVECIWPWAS